MAIDTERLPLVVKKYSRIAARFMIDHYDGSLERR
jgi:hypothetical protein